MYVVNCFLAMHGNGALKNKILDFGDEFMHIIKYKNIIA